MATLRSLGPIAFFRWSLSIWSTSWGGTEHGDWKIKIPQKKVFAAIKRNLNRMHDMREKSAGQGFDGKMGKPYVDEINDRL